MTTTEERKYAGDEENKDDDDEEEVVQSIPELQNALREYTEQMKDIDQLEDGKEKEEMKRELKEVIELTREVLKERVTEEKEEEERKKQTTTMKMKEEEEDAIEKELEDLENLRQTEEEEAEKRKREEEEKKWKVLKRPSNGEDGSHDEGRIETTKERTRKENGDEERDGTKPPPKNLLYRGADDKPTYDEEGNLIVPRRLQIQDDDDKVTRDRKRKQLQTFKYKQKQKADVSEHAKRASSWNDFKTKKAGKKKRLDNMSSGVFKKKSMFSGVGEGEREVSKLTVPKKHRFHSS